MQSERGGETELEALATLKELVMDWPNVATFDGPPPKESLVLDARDGDTATYRACTNPECQAIKAGTEHAHLVKVERNTAKEQL